MLAARTTRVPRRARRPGRRRTGCRRCASRCRRALLEQLRQARRDERVGVDLPVRMRERHPDLLAAVLEDEDLVDPRGAESCGAVHPRLHDRRTRAAARSANAPSWSLVKTTTSHRPTPVAARPTASPAAPSGRSRSTAVEATGTGWRRRPPRSRVRHLGGPAGSRRVQSGHSSAPGRNVPRPAGATAMMTHSPISTSHRSCAGSRPARARVSGGSCAPGGRVAVEVEDTRPSARERLVRITPRRYPPR